MCVQVGHDYTMGKSLGTHCERWIAIAGTCDTYALVVRMIHMCAGLTIALSARGNIRTLELFAGGDPRACRVIIPVGMRAAH